MASAGKSGGVGRTEPVKHATSEGGNVQTYFKSPSGSRLGLFEPRQDLRHIDRRGRSGMRPWVKMPGTQKLENPLRHLLPWVVGSWWEMHPAKHVESHCPFGNDIRGERSHVPVVFEFLAGEDLRP